MSNVTFTGLTITNCGAPLPENLEHEIPRSPDVRQFTEVKATVLVLASLNVTLSKVQLLRSPGFAIAAINTRRSIHSLPTPSGPEGIPILRSRLTQQSDFLFEDQNPSLCDHGTFQSCIMSSSPKLHNIMIEDSDISHSQMGSLIVHRIAGVLIRTTLNNNSIGILSTSSDIETQDLTISQCPLSSLESGSFVITGNLKSEQSSFHVRKYNLRIHSGRVVFFGLSALNFKTALTAIDSVLDIGRNSEVLFTGFDLLANTSALITKASSIMIHDNSSLIFTNNFASDGASISASIDRSIVSVVRNSSLVFSHNSVRNAWTLFTGFSSSWNVRNDATFVLENNTASDGGRIVEFYNTDTRIVDDACVSLHKNTIQRNSMLAVVNNGIFSLHDRSSLHLAQNYAINRSKMLLITGNMSFYDIAQTLIANNSIVKNSSIIILQPKESHPEAAQVYSYYRMLIDELDEKTEAGRVLKRQVVPAQFPLGNISLDGINIDQDVSTVPNIQIPIPSPTRETWQFLPPSTFEQSDTSILTFEWNIVTQQSVGFACIECSILNHDSVKLSFANNTCLDSSYVIFLSNATTHVQNRAVVEITHNKMNQDSSILLSQHGQWRVDSGATFSVIANTAQDGFSILFFSTMVELFGTVLVHDNVLSDFGALNSINSKVYFQGRLECSGNVAESGTINADNSDLYFTEEALFSDNSAANGGAVSLVSSVMHISPNATINFTRNHASGFGGAVYITNPRNGFICDALSSTAASCSFQVFKGSPDDCEFFTLTFNQNTAGIAGNAVYGGRTAACIPSNNSMYCTDCSSPDFSEIFKYNGVGDTSNFTSDPTRVCFCENGIPDCYKVTRDVVVYPGEVFHLSLATVGYGLGTVPGSVVARTKHKKVRVPGKNSFGSDLEYSQDIGTECRGVSYSILSEQVSEQISLAVNTLAFGRSLEQVRAVVDFQLTRDTRDISPILRSPYDSLLETFYRIPVFVQVHLLPCPVGFQQDNGRCVCAQILLDNQLDMCFIVNGTPIIHRPSPYWLGLPADNLSSILIHMQCPFDYCQLEDLNITAENPDGQCQFQRTGTLCGRCREGLSMVLGSSDCKKCSNAFVTLILVFAVAGLVLVVFLTLLNMTVSVGTINGLILFANIVQGNKTAFLPPPTANTSILITLLRTFISWMNLDLGITTCFFNGLTAYIKIWLQFLFPLYILAIVSVVIIASYYSTQVTKLFGTNAVSVLATLILLSYTKILRVLIAVFSFTTIEGTNDHSSVVWLYDGNVEYFESRHVVLFMAALLVLLFLGFPYTAMLIVAPWMQRSKYNWISSIYNKFKPLFDAYMGPYKDKCRYWTGMLLLARVALIVLFSTLINQGPSALPVSPDSVHIMLASSDDGS